MSYNRFQWWRSSLKRKSRPLTGKNVTLEEKIAHGDYDYPDSYLEAIFSVEADIADVTQSIQKEYKGRSEQGLNQDIRDATRMKNVRKIKLELEMYEKEAQLLHNLRRELNLKFGVDLWDKIGTVDHAEMKTVEDLYQFYEQRSRT